MGIPYSVTSSWYADYKTNGYPIFCYKHLVRGPWKANGYSVFHNKHHEAIAFRISIRTSTSPLLRRAYRCPNLKFTRAESQWSSKNMHPQAEVSSQSCLSGTSGPASWTETTTQGSKIINIRVDDNDQ